MEMLYPIFSCFFFLWFLVLAVSGLWKRSNLKKIYSHYKIPKEVVPLARERVGKDAVSFGLETAGYGIVTIYHDRSGLFFDVSLFFFITNFVLYLPFADISLKKAMEDGMTEFCLAKCLDITIRATGLNQIIKAGKGDH